MCCQSCICFAIHDLLVVLAEIGSGVHMQFVTFDVSCKMCHRVQT
jgi:hypothetical protein